MIDLYRIDVKIVEKTRHGRIKIFINDAPLVSFGRHRVGEPDNADYWPLKGELAEVDPFAGIDLPEMDPVDDQG